MVCKKKKSKEIEKKFKFDFIRSDFILYGGSGQ